MKNIKSLSRICVGSYQVTALILVAGAGAFLDYATPWQAALAQTTSTISSTFQNGGSIPIKYTADGADTSPPLRWHVGTSGTVKSFCVLCNDPDAPNGNWVHWVAFDIPPNVDNLPEGASANARTFAQGVNSFGKVGWNGPTPARGKAHRYVFTVFALDDLPQDLGRASEKDLRKRIAGHILGTAQLIGLFKR